MINSNILILVICNLILEQHLLINFSYQTALADFQQYAADDTPDEETVFRITNALKKLAIFYDIHNLGPWRIWNLLWEPWVKAHVSQQTSVELPVDAVRYAISACESSLIWDMKSIVDGGGHHSAVTPALLRDSVYEYMACLSTLLMDNQLSEEAFMRLCDMLIYFSREFKNVPGQDVLYYEPSDMMIEDLKRFIEKRVFVADDHDDGMDEQQKIENLHRRRKFLAAYCKLGIYNVIDIPHLKLVFRNYMRFYNDYGDIIKATLGKAREINKVICANTMVEALFSLFRDLDRDRNGCIDRGSEQFSNLKELAKRFALSFGLDNLKNREAIAAFHRRGIQLAAHPLENELNSQLTHPPNLAFLELLLDLVNKLMKQDRRVVCAYLEKSIPARLPVSKFDDWEPHRLYR